MSDIVCVTWSIIPLHPPLPRRHCGSCNATRLFMSSGRFRTNAQKKRMDIWLIYRCAVCGETWNMPVVERCPIARIPPDRLQAFIRNDSAAAARHAFDLAVLARHSNRIDQNSAAVRKHIASGSFDDAAFAEIVIALPLPCRLRLDGLMARELGITRNALLTACEAGMLVPMRATRKAMRAPAFDGQRIRVDLSKAKNWGIETDRLWRSTV